ncbi:MAG: class II fructose-bisphosphate aldolase [Chloroflexota bacterium]|nr:class II fructose-bisphosphate aldolase [Chloroflexota bacterium]
MTTTHPMNPFGSIGEMLEALAGIARVHHDPANQGIEILDEAGFRDGLIDRLIATAVFAQGSERDAARWIIRVAAPELGAWPASIHALYMAAGRGEYANRTAPAINVRGLAYDTMRAVYRAARANDCKIMLFELARSEMSYTQQRPGEYASNALAAAIKEGHQGPVFIQGDHYQISAKNYASDPEKEVSALRDLITEAIAAGYFNIDIDASTIVDLSLPTLAEQQALNAHLTAMFTEHIRDHEPEGVTVSIGGEIGEVGARNSTVQDLHAFMTAFMTELQDRERMLRRDLAGISKISVQTGTSHGGVILPDGTVADVAVDFKTLQQLSEVARINYGLGGAVQHGASTLPEQAFGRFAEASAVEVHLATAFQNQIFEHAAFPADLKDEIYVYLSANHGDERMEGQTDAQFFYGARKRAFGSFKQQLWDLSVETRDRIADDLESSFSQLMQRLGVAGSGELVDQMVPRVDVPAPMPDALAATLAGEAVTVGASAEATLEEVEGE